MRRLRQPGQARSTAGRHRPSIGEVLRIVIVVIVVVIIIIGIDVRVHGQQMGLLFSRRRTRQALLGEVVLIQRGAFHDGPVPGPRARETGGASAGLTFA